MKDFFFAHTLTVNSYIAGLCGTDAGLIFNHILYWLKMNTRNKNAFREGRVWMYETQKQMSEFIGWLSEDVIGRALKKLVQAGLIIKGNFNKNSYDRTNWYTVADQSIINGGYLPANGDQSSKGGKNTNLKNCGKNDVLTGVCEPESIPTKLRNGDCMPADSLYKEKKEEKQKKQQQHTVQTGNDSAPASRVAVASFKEDNFDKKSDGCAKKEKGVSSNATIRETAPRSATAYAVKKPESIPTETKHPKDKVSTPPPNPHITCIIGDQNEYLQNKLYQKQNKLINNQGAFYPPIKDNPRGIKIYPCLENLDIPIEDKKRLTGRHLEDAVKNAVEWATHPQTVISKGIVPALYWAASNRPAAPKNPIDQFKLNYTLAKGYDEHKSAYATVFALSQYVEITYPASQRSSDVIRYDDKLFEEKFQKLITAARIK